MGALTSSAVRCGVLPVGAGRRFRRRPSPAHRAERRAAACLPPAAKAEATAPALLMPDFRVFFFLIVAFFQRHLIRADLPFVLERDSQVEENFV